MSEPRLRLGLAGTTLLALVAALGACSSDDGGGDQKEPAASQTTAAEPPAGPVAGACYPLPFDVAVAPTSDVEAVDCAQPHTSETVAVGTVDPVVDGHLLAIDSEQAQVQVASACPQRLIEYVGGSVRSLRLSMVRPVWFTPTVEDSDAGATWFRCDAVVLAGSERLAETTGSLKNALKGGNSPKSLAMCGTAAPDAANFERVPCSAKHSWRAIDIVVFQQDDYPGEKLVRAAGRAQCEDAGAEAADDPLVFKWGYEWPTKEQWDTGQKFGRCWAPV